MRSKMNSDRLIIMTIVLIVGGVIGYLIRDMVAKKDGFQPLILPPLHLKPKQFDVYTHTSKVSGEPSELGANNFRLRDILSNWFY